MKALTSPETTLPISFEIGQPYTRNQIHEVLGGDKSSSFPQRHKRIVCGCFSLERNPQAPQVILIEDKAKVVEKLHLLLSQNESIPVFVKRFSSHWVYQGYFRVLNYSTNEQEVEEMKKISLRDNIVAVLHLEKAD